MFRIKSFNFHVDFEPWNSELHFLGETLKIIFPTLDSKELEIFFGPLGSNLDALNIWILSVSSISDPRD